MSKLGRSLVLTLLSFSTACVSEFGDDVALSTSEQDALLATTKVWNTRELHVCFEVTGYEDRKSLIRQAVDRTWGNESGVGFSWDGLCSAAPIRDLRVGFTSGTGLTVTLGSDNDDFPNAILLNISTDTQLRYYSVHEFGHALAFDHEFARSETSDQGCPESSPSPFSDVTVGSWDLYSIMNYSDAVPACDNPYDISHARLSQWDIDAVSKFYGGAHPVAAVSPFNGEITLLARRSLSGAPHVDGRLFARLFNYTPWGDGWASWVDLGTSDGQALTSAPTAVSWSSNRIDVFLRSSLGHLVQIARNSSVWSSWADLGGNIAGQPVVVSRAFNRLTIVARDTTMPTNGIAIREWDGSVWLPWVSIAGDVIGTPSAVVAQDGSVHVFVRWGDDSLRVFRSAATGSWNGQWTNLAGGMQGSPSAVVMKNAANTPDIWVFVGGLVDMKLYAKHYAGGVWGGWQFFVGPSAGIRQSPTAISRDIGRIDLFVHDRLGNLWSIARDSSAIWTSWFQVSAGSPSAIASPTAVVGNASDISVFSRTDWASEIRQLHWRAATGWSQNPYTNWVNQGVY